MECHTGMEKAHVNHIRNCRQEVWPCKLNQHENMRVRWRRGAKEPLPKLATNRSVAFMSCFKSFMSCLKCAVL